MSAHQPEIVEAVKEQVAQPGQHLETPKTGKQCWFCTQAYRSAVDRFLIESFQSHADDHMAIHPSIGG